MEQTAPKGKKRQKGGEGAHCGTPQKEEAAIW